MCAMENNAVSCKIKIPKTLTDKTPVFLAKFSNGCVNINSPKPLTLLCCRHASDEGKTDSSARRVLCASNGRLNYKSEVTDSHDKCESYMNYFVGVRNKATGRMRVYESLSFRMNPEITRKSLSNSASEERNVREKLDDLTLNFGSKGKQRSMIARQRYSDTVSENLDDMDLDDFKITSPKPAADRKSSFNIEYIPPQNREAKCAGEVYDIGDVVPPLADEFLSKRAQQLLQDLPSHLSQWEADSEYCGYILEHLKNEPSQVKTKYLLYYHFLWKFSNFLSPEFRKKDPAKEIPEPIRSHLLDCFTVTSAADNKKPVRTFPLMMKDKLLAYLIVLALFIDDYKVNLALLQKNSKYSMTKIDKVAQTLGCHVVNRKVGNLNVKFAELRVPLNFPKMYFKK